MKLSTLLLCIAAFVFVALAALAASQQSRQRGVRGKIRGRPPLTKREQSMYFRLTQTFPEHVVLAQVAFSALVTANSRQSRNYFDRKVADFVLCTRGFSVLAVIELDDKSHEGKATADATRDAMLSEGGYRVLRYAQIPDSEQLKADFAPKPV